LKGFDSGIELFQKLSSWFSWYNKVHPQLKKGATSREEMKTDQFP